MDASHVYVRAWVLGCLHSLICTQTFRRALTASVPDRCTEIRSVPSAALPIMAESGGRVPKSEAWSVRVLMTIYRKSNTLPRRGRPVVDAMLEAQCSFGVHACV